MLSIKSQVMALIAISVICMCVLFHSNNTKLYAAQSVKNAMILQKQAEDSAELYRKKIDSLTQINLVLQQKVSDNDKALQHAKQTNQLLAKKVSILTADVQTETDTVTKLTDCDSLAAAVTELSYSNANKDSLYEQMEIDLKAEVVNKDSVISIQHNSYNALKTTFDLSISRQDTVEHNCRFLQKQLNHQVFKKKFLSASLLTLSGITLYSLLRH